MEISNDKTTVLLVRHGETGVLPESQGPEESLSKEGEREVKALRKSLRNVSVDAYYSSPYRRAVETAHILAGKDTVVIDNRLREIPLWVDPAELVRDERRLELAKILVEAQEGMSGFLESAVRRNSGGTLAVVCHGNIIRASLALLLEMNLETIVRLHVSTASVTALRSDKEFTQLLFFSVKPDITAPLFSPP